MTEAKALPSATPFSPLGGMTFRRDRSRNSSRLGELGTSAVTELGPPAFLELAQPSSSMDPENRASEARSSAFPASSVSPTSANPDPSQTARVPPERLHLSQRVVLHIYQQGRLMDDEVATLAFTQAGMSEKLGIGQSPISNILRRLEVGGVLKQDVRHVFGRPRRLRVYRLTAMGEALALELMRRRPRPGTPGASPIP